MVPSNPPRKFDKLKGTFAFCSIGGPVPPTNPLYVLLGLVRDVCVFTGFHVFLYFRLFFWQFSLARCLFCAAFFGGFSGAVPVWGCVFVLVLWGAMWDPFGDIWEDGGWRSDL